MRARAPLAVCFSVLFWASVTPAGRAEWTYVYEDDFSTDKAIDDSYEHSIFWPELAWPPPEPYLFYTFVVQPPEALGFARYYDEPAHLAYCFPLEPGGPAEVRGTMELDVYIEEPDVHHLSVSVSPDGTNWTPPAPLESGHREVPLGSGQGTCYVRLTGLGSVGSAVVVDNLHVTLCCYGDLDGDGEIGLADLATLLGNYGATEGATYYDGDMDDDGDVDLSDLAALLAVYGTTCE